MENFSPPDVTLDPTPYQRLLNTWRILHKDIWNAILDAVSNAQTHFNIENLPMDQQSSSTLSYDPSLFNFFPTFSLEPLIHQQWTANQFLNSNASFLDSNALFSNTTDQTLQESNMQTVVESNTNDDGQNENKDKSEEGESDSSNSDDSDSDNENSSESGSEQIKDKEVCEFNKESVQMLRKEGWTLKQMAIFWNMNVLQLKVFCHKNKIYRYSKLQHKDLKTQIKKALQKYDVNMGWKMMQGHLRTQGIHVGQRKILKILNDLTTSEEIQGRQSYRQVGRMPGKRREYKTAGSNHVWHIDGYEKLFKWGFYIHGAIDGHSRYIVWLIVTNSKKASVVYKAYQSAVDKFGISQNVRSDKGTETKLICFAHTLQKHNYITGRSKENNKIERLWVEVRKWMRIFRDLFTVLEEEGLLDVDDIYHLGVLRKVFKPKIAKHLQKFQNSYNTHGMTGKVWKGRINKIPEKTFKYERNVSIEEAKKIHSISLETIMKLYPNNHLPADDEQVNTYLPALSDMESDILTSAVKSLHTDFKQKETSKQAEWKEEYLLVMHGIKFLIMRRGVNNYMQVLGNGLTQSNKAIFDRMLIAVAHTLGIEAICKNDSDEEENIDDGDNEDNQQMESTSMEGKQEQQEIIQDDANHTEDDTQLNEVPEVSAEPEGTLVVYLVVYLFEKINTSMQPMIYQHTTSKVRWSIW